MRSTGFMRLTCTSRLPQCPACRAGASLPDRSGAGRLAAALLRGGAGGPFVRLKRRRAAVRLLDRRLAAGIARTLAGRGFYRWRGEAFDVRAEPDGPVLAEIDRGALPSFRVAGASGFTSTAWCGGADGLHLWVGRRAANKHLDPASSTMSWRAAFRRDSRRGRPC